MVLKTLSREISILEDSNTKSSKDFEVKPKQKCEIELAENEQDERMNILLSGIAIILLGNTRKYPLRGYFLGVLSHTTAWDRHWGPDETLEYDWL